MAANSKISNGVLYGVHASRSSIGNPMSIEVPSTETKTFAVMFNRYVCDSDDEEPPYVDPCDLKKSINTKNNGNHIDRIYACLPIVSYPNLFNNFPNSDFPVTCHTQAHLVSIYYPNNSLSFNVNPCASNFSEIILSQHFFLSSHSIIKTRDNYSITDSVAHPFALYSALIQTYCDKYNTTLNNIPTKKLMLLQKEVAPFNNLANWRGTTHSLSWDELMDNLLSTNVLIVENVNNNGSFTKIGKWPVIPFALELNYYSKTLDITLLIKLQYFIEMVGYNLPDTGIVGTITNNIGCPALGKPFIPIAKSKEIYNNDPIQLDEEC